MTNPVRLSRESVRNILLDAINDDDILGSNDALAVVDRIFDRMAKAVRRDPRFPQLSQNELDLVLADARRDAGEELTELLTGRIYLHVALDAVLGALAGEPS